MKGRSESNRSAFDLQSDPRLTDPTLGQPQPTSCTEFTEDWGGATQPYWRPGANPTVDLVVTRDTEAGREILLVKRADRQEVAERGKWALPGGFHDSEARKGELWRAGKETAQEAALRELVEETQLDARELESRVLHVGFFDTFGRDPRDNPLAWAVSNAFKLHLSPKFAKRSVAGTDDADEAKWVPVRELENLKLAFDHQDIIKKALG